MDPLELSLSFEDKLNRFLRKLRNNKKLDEGILNIYARGSSPGILYELPKVHKPDVPIRPILAAYTTHNYNLGKFLVPLLTPFTKNEYTVSNSYCFKKGLNLLNIYIIIIWLVEYRVLIH